MGRLLPLPSHALLAALYLSTAASGSSLVSRQSTCPANFSKCPQASLPANFCCPSNSTCVPLAANTTVLCCPAGKDCAQIATITCDISLQDPATNPNSTIKTTALDAVLGKCGTRCCPFGYSCNKQNNCEKDQNQAVAPQPASSSIASSSTAIPTSTSTSTTSSSPTAILAPNITDTPPAALPIEKSCPRFPTPAILLFFFAGLLTGITLSVLIICAIGGFRRSRAKTKLRRASTQSFGNIAGISSPHLQEQTAARTDFLRKKEWDASPTTLNSTPKRQTTIKRVRSLFQRTPGGGSFDSDAGGGGRPLEGTPVPAIPPLNIQKQNSKKKPNPVTPPQQRAPSSQDEYGDIMVFTDGETASALRRQNSSSPNKIKIRIRDKNADKDTSKEKETGLSGLGIGRGNTMASTTQGGGGLLPPPAFLGGRDTERGSQGTTFTAMIEKSREDSGGSGAGGSGSTGRKGHERTGSGLAGLQKGQPYVYKGSPGYSTAARRSVKM